jgi:hypothetical protein
MYTIGGHMSTSLLSIYSLPCAMLFLWHIQFFAVCNLQCVPCVVSLLCVFDIATVCNIILLFSWTSENRK